MYRAKVTLYDEHDNEIDSDYAYGNTKRACDAAAGAIRRDMENVHEDEHPGCNGIIGKTERMKEARVTKAEILRRLHEAHEAAQGKGDQGAFDVWNAVSAILKERA